MAQRQCLFFILFFAFFILQNVKAATGETPCFNAPSVKVKIAQSGLYRIPGDDLLEAFGCKTFSTKQLRLTNQGNPIVYSMMGQAKSSPSDLIFFGRHLAGPNSFYNEFSQFNTYWLTLEDLPVTLQEKNPQGDHSKPASALNSWTRIEQDELRVRFTGRADAQQPEVWYWVRLNSIDPKPFVIPLDFQQRKDDTPVGIRLGLRGWSKLDKQKFPALADHKVEVFLNGHLIGSSEWHGQEKSVLEIPEIPVDILRDDDTNQLSLRVPERTPSVDGPPLVDAVLLNWVELSYQHQGVLSKGQHYFRVAHQEGGWFQLSGPGASPPVLMNEQGQQLKPYESYRRGQRHWHRYATLEGSSSFVAAAGDAFYQPVAVVGDTPSNLLNPAQQADYLILTHRRLRQAIEPLADFHRKRGLGVQVIDIEDVYDEFNHGVLAPSAIRDFISHAYHNWQSPKPRFVLLVGDASWDVRNEVGIDRNYADWTFQQREKQQFLKNQSSTYTDELSAADRNLIPSWPVETYEGYAASDNVFVAVDGDDYLPDLAIGRFPVSNPSDVVAIVNKTIAYHQQSDVGPWRRKVLWVTNEQPGLQSTSNQLDAALAGAGFAGDKIYPSAQEKDNIEHQAALQSAFDDGQLLVHFVGHGGRYVWRTGPPDYRKNHDLFTLDHLEKLAPSNRLPFVMSMTCYSAPFDHPTADSIGEKFLRIPDRGAIGILAASWRNYPTQSFSQAVLDELIVPGTMGEAVMRAKQKQKSRLMIETYNLLGDPAARLALPRHEIELETRESRDHLKIRGRVIDSSFDGQVVIDWHDSNGVLIGSRQLALNRGKFKLQIDQTSEPEIGRVSAYAWNPEQGIDAMGGLVLIALEDPLQDMLAELKTILQLKAAQQEETKNE